MFIDLARAAKLFNTKMKGATCTDLTFQICAKNLDEAIQKHDLASTKLFGSLDSVTDLTQLNAAELEARASIFRIAADLAEVCVSQDKDEAKSLFERLKSHLENWEIASANCDEIFARAKGNSFYQFLQIL